MRATRTVLVLGALALAIVALPAGAAAKPGYIRLAGLFYFQLELGRSDGYALSAVGGRGQVIVTAKGHATSASYAARGFANRRRLQVDLGRFGRIAVRLERSPRVAHDPLFFGDNCHGRPPWQLHGAASGRIRFRGLGGFVSIDKRRAKAEVVRTFDSVCKREPGTTYAVAKGSGLGLGLRSDALAAERRVDGETVEFTASNLLLAGEKLGSISATTSQRLDGVEVRSSASAPSAGKDLWITHRGVRPPAAKVRGSGPFAGESSYRQLPGGEAEWSGSLRVELPGEGAVPLSGPGFDAEICHGSGFGAFEGCQSSGSHSQSLFAARLSWSR